MKEINEEITLKFSYNGNENSFKCHKKEKIKNIFILYCQIKQIEIDSVYFLYGGDKINDFEQTFEQLGNNKKDNYFSFIVNSYPKSVLIKFIHSNDIDIDERDAGDQFEDIFSDYASRKNINKNKLKFKYKDNEIDPRITIDEFIKKDNINIKELYLNKMKEKPNEEMNENVDGKMNETTNEKNEKENEIINETINTMNAMSIDESENKIEIKIDVEDVPFWPTFYSNHKKAIIFFFSFLLIIFVAGISILNVFISEKGLNIGSNIPTSYQIPKDYFIKATYISKAGENIRLISDIYNLNKIQKMTIDGKTAAPTKNYDFQDGGEHIIYFSFNNYTSESSFSEGSGIFSGIENLKYVEFSNYTKYYPDIRFKGMFNNCINLESVDLSQIKLYYEIFKIGFGDNEDSLQYFSEYLEYLNSMEYMFNNCTSLKSLNFDIKISDNSDDYIMVMSQKFFF